MKKQIKHILLSIIMVQISVAVACADDSIPAQELKEVEVMGERAWISEDGTFNFIPTKKEKRLSNSPASLIGAMNLPLLRESDGSITLTTGESVEIFINGEKAEEIDLSTFWPMDVKTVQYMENPKDSKYAGAKHAVNFITRRYKAGGVARANAFQVLPNNGSYSLASKLVYKKMTFGAKFSGAYFREHRASSYGETTYSNLYYDGDFHDEIKRNEENKSVERTDVISCVLNAKYSSDKFIANHTFLINWQRDPENRTESTGTWTDNLFGSSYSSSSSSSRTLSPQIIGSYYVKFSEKWHMPWSVGYIFNDNEASSLNRTGNSPDIYNHTKEKINTLNVGINPWYYVSKRMYVQLNLSAQFQSYSTSYSGSSDVQQDQSRLRSTANITLGWSPINTLNVTFNPGFFLTQWNIGDVHEHTLFPTANTSIRWSPSRKYSMSGSLSFGVTPPKANESNPVIVRESELMWSVGNPYLKNRTLWDADLYNTYLVKNGLSLGAMLSYTHYNGEIIPDYKPASIDKGGLIRENVNAKDYRNLRASVSVNWTIPGTHLSMSVDPQWNYTHVKEGQDNGLHSFYLSGKANYSFGNCRVNLNYSSPRRGLHQSGMERTWGQDRCDIGFTYGNGNLFLNVRVFNVFHSHMKRWQSFTSPHFSTNYTTFKTGRQLIVDFTYTFGYGRKVDRNIDISDPQSVESSVNHAN